MLVFLLLLMMVLVLLVLVNATAAAAALEDIQVYSVFVLPETDLKCLPAWLCVCVIRCDFLVVCFLLMLVRYCHAVISFEPCFRWPRQDAGTSRVCTSKKCSLSGFILLLLLHFLLVLVVVVCYLLDSRTSVFPSRSNSTPLLSIRTDWWWYSSRLKLKRELVWPFAARFACQLFLSPLFFFWSSSWSSCQCRLLPLSPTNQPTSQSANQPVCLVRWPVSTDGWWKPVLTLLFTLGYNNSSNSSSAEMTKSNLSKKNHLCADVSALTVIISQSAGVVLFCL